MPHPSLAAFAVLLSLAGCQTVRRLEQRPLPAQSPYAEEEDSDRDGLRDSEERELAERFAPVMILHGKDWARPASATWFLTESAQRPDNPSAVARQTRTVGMADLRACLSLGGPSIHSSTVLVLLPLQRWALGIRPFGGLGAHHRRAECPERTPRSVGRAALG